MVGCKDHKDVLPNDRIFYFVSEDAREVGYKTKTRIYAVKGCQNVEQARFALACELNRDKLDFYVVH